MDGFVRWQVRHPAAVLLAFAALTAALGSAALRIRIEGSLESMLAPDDPEVLYYADIRTVFGSDDIGVVGVRTPNLFSVATLQKIERITERIAAVEGVQQVMSITNALDPAADAYDPPKLIPNLRLTPHEVDALKDKLSTTSLYANNLVAPSFDGAAINVFLENLTDAQYQDLGIDRRISEILAAESGPEQLFYTGASHVKQVAVEYMRRDLFRFTPIALALVMLVLWLSFRRLPAVALPLISVSLAMVWTLGVMVLTGKAITIGTFVLPPLLLVIGSSYGIHVLAYYHEETRAGGNSADAVLHTVQRVRAPLLISALTTAIGFGALTANRITAIWDLGVFSVVGLLFLAMSSLGFLPAAMQLSTTPASLPLVGRGSPSLYRLLAQLAASAYKERAMVLSTAGVVALTALAGVQFIRVDSDFLAYFDPQSQVRHANEIINQEIVGSNPFYLVIESGEPGTLKRWEVLKQIKELQSFLATLPGITTSISIVDYLELLEIGLNKGGEEDYSLDDEGNLVPFVAAEPFWENRNSLEPILKTVSSNAATFSGVVTPDFARGNILVRCSLSGSRQVERLLGRIRTYIKQQFPATIQVHPTGTLVLMTGTASEIVFGQIKSLALALAVIFIVMALMFLSVRVGLLAILPNLLAILVFFGVLGWAGVFLNLGTSLIGTVALGIAVDSTIHYMTRLSRQLKREADQATAMKHTMSTVGVPIIYTAIALLFGFLTFAGSSFVPIRSFGLLTSMTLAAALGANLFVLPALLATTKIITLWDLVGIRLGKDPARTIPLLAGLRPAQARIVVLMGELRRFPAGAVIVRRGELGREMYVMIDGAAEVWVGAGRERKRIAELRRGEVFGEMAFVRRDERSADVVASQPVEVLAVDEHFLDRIQSRYPRIAAKVFLNLTRILSDRLQRLTDQLIGLPP